MMRETDNFAQHPESDWFKSQERKRCMVAKRVDGIRFFRFFGNEIALNRATIQVENSFRR